MEEWKQIIKQVFHELDNHQKIFHSFQKIDNNKIRIFFTNLYNKTCYTIDLTKDMSQSKVSKIIKKMIT